MPGCLSMYERAGNPIDLSRAREHLRCRTVQAPLYIIEGMHSIVHR
jgi:hypothetical protein